jgi:5-methylcytosine-specific restriction endonuclease McrA
VFTPSHIRVRTCSLTCGQKLRWAEGRIPDSLIKYATNDERAAGTRDMWQRKNRRRRTLKRGGVSERYTLVEIAERDGHRCRLCDRKVPMAQKHPRPLSPTIDHIVPISLGGDDTRVNVQLAHRICNIRKSNRGAGDQLALVG